MTGFFFKFRSATWSSIPGNETRITVGCIKPTIQIWRDGVVPTTHRTLNLLRILWTMKVDKGQGRKSKLCEILVWIITSYDTVYSIVLNYNYIYFSVLRSAQIETSLLYILYDCCPLLAACWCRLKNDRSLCTYNISILQYLGISWSFSDWIHFTRFLEATMSS